MKLIKKSAFAKINLGLEVLNKREDGFHNINTVFSRINIADELMFSESEKIEVLCDVNLGIKPEENLVYKAAMKLKKKYAIEKGAKIEIHKNIPAGAGLGGGSSDAASALLGLVELWDIKFNYQDLFIIALSLGSDIPFFLKKGTAFAQSRGEKLFYFDYKLPYKCVLAMPEIHISTPWAYRALERGEKVFPATNLPLILQKSLDNPSLLAELVHNHFEKPVFEQYSKIAEIKQEFYNNQAIYSSLSGSGSAVFGLFANDYLAEQAASRLNKLAKTILA